MKTFGYLNLNPNSALDFIRLEICSQIFMEFISNDEFGLNLTIGFQRYYVTLKFYQGRKLKCYSSDLCRVVIVKLK